LNSFPPVHENERIQSVAWSGGANRIVSGTDRNIIRIWNVHTITAEPVGNNHPRLATGWCKDKTNVISASKDGVAIWDVKTGEKLQILTEHREECIFLSWNHDGSKLASVTSDGIRIWVFGLTGKSSRKFLANGSPEETLTVSWNHDSSKILRVGEESITIWDTETGRLWKTLDTAGTWSVSWNHRNGTIITVSRYGGTKNGGTVKVWNEATGELQKTLESMLNNIRSVSLSPDGNRIATESWDNIFKIWVVDTGEVLNTLEGRVVSLRRRSHNLKTTAGVVVAWNRDGSRLVSGSEDGSMRVWDGKTGELLKVLGPLSCGVVSINWSWDGTRIIFACDDYFIRAFYDQSYLIALKEGEENRNEPIEDKSGGQENHRKSWLSRFYQFYNR
jgi:WD40 repeat protein